jgi:hypothetical protein
MKLRISFFSDPSGANALPLPLAYRNAEFDSVERAQEIPIADATRPGANAHSIIIESVDGGTIRLTPGTGMPNYAFGGASA